VASGDEILPERLADRDGLLLRRWLPDDAQALTRAVDESREHLRPWMPWIGEETMTIEQRRSMLIGFERDWLGGGEMVLGVFLHGRVAGGAGYTVGSLATASSSAIGCTRTSPGAAWRRPPHNC
jgi:hypothetical protein